MTKNVLKVDKIVKIYPNFLLDKVSLDLEEGTITGFIGKNGAGKSTTLKAIMRLIKVESGTIKFGMDEIENAYSIGYLGMEKGIYPDESLENIVHFVAKAWGRSWSEREYRYYAETVFGLHAKQKMKELSTGMVIKFLLSMELAKNPKLLLLDEPTSGLDPVVREEILTILKELVQKKGMTVLFSSHITEDIVKIADRVIFIDNGQIVLQGSKEAILQKYVKMGRESVEELSNSISLKIFEYGTLNRGFYIWDNEVLRINSPNIEKTDLDEILVALGGRKQND